MKFFSKQKKKWRACVRENELKIWKKKSWGEKNILIGASISI